MAVSQVVAFSTNTVADNQTRQLGGVSTSNNVAAAQQEYVQALCREAGTFDRAYCTIVDNTCTSDSTFRFRSATGTNGNQFCTIGALQTGEFEDTTNSDTLTASSAFNWQLSVPNTVASTSVTIKTISARFTPTDSSKTISWLFGGGSGQNYSGANETTFSSPSGSLKSIISEAACQIRIPSSFLARNFGVMCATNARLNDTTVRNRINSADGSQSVVIGSTQTGWFEDASNTDALVDGDDYAYSITTLSGTQVINLRSISNTLESTNDEFLLAAGAPDGLIRASTGSDIFAALSANISQSTTVEAEAVIRPAFSFTISKMHVRATANTTTATQGAKLRQNSADSGMGITIPAGNTGLFSDTTNSVSVASGDSLALMFDLAGSGSGNIQYNQITLLASHGAGSPTGYTLTADSGTFISTGTIASLLKDYLLSAQNVNFVISGTGAALKIAKVLAANGDSYTIVGTDAALLRARRVIASGGSISVNGTAASLVTGRKIAAGSGAYTWTGTAADLVVETANNTILTAEGGIYLVSGASAALLRSLLLDAQAGSFTITGTAANLEKSIIMSAAGAAYVLTGTNTVFGVGRVVSAGSGPFVITGMDAILDHSGIDEPTHISALALLGVG